MNTILFDLDGTLLPMDVEEFTKKYFGYIMQTMNQNKRDGKMIIHAILKATKHMFTNNRTCTNEELFWKIFEETTSISQKEIEPEFIQFYETMFDKINTGIQNMNMIEAIRILKEKGYCLILTTNPLFPRIATEKRIKWAGLNPSDFTWITTYENSSACKPNLLYYEEVIENLHLNKNECMMVGNDVKEDGAIEKLNIPLYLVNDYLLNSDHLEITSKWYGNSQSFLKFVQQLPNI